MITMVRLIRYTSTGATELSCDTDIMGRGALCLAWSLARWI